MQKPDLDIVGRVHGPVVFDYSCKDVILYALGVGAGPDDLSLIYEEAPGGLRVLPSFCLVPAMQMLLQLAEGVYWPRFIHAEQVIRVPRPLPPEGRLIQQGQVKAIYDRGKAAIYKVEINGNLENGAPAYQTQWTIFYLGAGGFGGEPGPKGEEVESPPGAEPNFALTDRVATNQAALYRLSGDLNPLHIDPAAAKRSGFDKPILHGLCTYGFAVRSVVMGPLQGKVDRLREFRARFSAPVHAGDTLTTNGWAWRGGYLIQMESQNGTVLNNGLALVSDG